MVLENIVLSLWIIQFLEKLWKIRENIEILHMSQHKEEDTF